jgi:hypothetical protein
MRAALRQLEVQYTALRVTLNSDRQQSQMQRALVAVSNCYQSACKDPGFVVECVCSFFWRYIVQLQCR